MTSLLPLSTLRFRWGLVGVLLVAGIWRGTMALLLPVIARDGVTFCWYARDLGADGLHYLQSEGTRQHPLYPAAILGTHRIALALGAHDGPLTWQRCAQGVSWTAGMAVVALVGVLTLRLAQRLELPLDARLAALLAMLWTAVLDAHVWLSADTMSDELHLALYFGAVLCTVGSLWPTSQPDVPRASPSPAGARRHILPIALGCGVLSGLAFLTRPEGAVAALAGLAALWARRREAGLRKLVSPALALACGFLLCATPYWCVVGRLSPKKDPFVRTASCVGLLPAATSTDSLRLATSPAGGQRYAAQAALLAKLERVDYSWYALLPQVLYKLFRAGRVLVPLLAIPALWSLRKRLAGPVLAGWTTCLTGHLSLTLILLARYNYLDARHMLVPVALLTPLAAMFATRGFSLLLDLRRYGLAVLAAAVCFLPPAVYGLRVPNGPDRYLADAALWLTRHDPDLASKRLLAGSSPQRIAFYAGMHWESWAEKPEQYSALARQVGTGRPGYLAIETGPGFERRGNREVLDKLLHDEHLAKYLGPVEVRPGPDAASELHLIQLRAPP